MKNYGIILIGLIFIIMKFNSFGGEELNGSPKVVDGDSLELNGKKIRLFGIDAPEWDQPCLRAIKRQTCGSLAKQYLKNEVIAGGEVKCVQKDKDNYGRSVSICYVNDTDIAMKMVKDGYAMAYRYFSKDYVQYEEEAKSKGAGLWSYGYINPRDYRNNKR